MREALNSVEQGMSVSKSSVIYGIPRSTLKDHVYGRVLPGAQPGAPTLLPPSEERDRVQLLCKCASTGYGKTRQDVMTIVTHMLTVREKRSMTGANLLIDIIRSSRYEHLPLYLYPERVPHPNLQ